MRLLLRAVVVVVLLLVLELVLARVVAAHDPIAALVTGDRLRLVLFGPLYIVRVFLFFAAPPWLAVRLVVAIGASRRADR